MNIVKAIAISTLVSTVIFATSVAFSEESKPAKSVEGTPPAMPHMMYGQPGHMPMMEGKQGQMSYMQMMQQRHAAADEHMKRMETHMANIEALLKQLVELQKK